MYVIAGHSRRCARELSKLMHAHFIVRFKNGQAIANQSIFSTHDQNTAETSQPQAQPTEGWRAIDRACPQGLQRCATPKFTAKCTNDSFSFDLPCWWCSTPKYRIDTFVHRFCLAFWSIKSFETSECESRIVGRSSSYPQFSRFGFFCERVLLVLSFRFLVFLGAAGRFWAWLSTTFRSNQQELISWRPFPF